MEVFCCGKQRNMDYGVRVYEVEDQIRHLGSRPSMKGQGAENRRFVMILYVTR